MKTSMKKYISIVCIVALVVGVLAIGVKMFGGFGSTGSSGGGGGGSKSTVAADPVRWTKATVVTEETVIEEGDSLIFRTSYDYNTVLQWLKGFAYEDNGIGQILANTESFSPNIVYATRTGTDGNYTYSVSVNTSDGAVVVWSNEVSARGWQNLDENSAISLGYQVEVTYITPYKIANILKLYQPANEVAEASEVESYAIVTSMANCHFGACDERIEAGKKATVIAYPNVGFELVMREIRVTGALYSFERISNGGVRITLQNPTDTVYILYSYMGDGGSLGTKNIIIQPQSIVVDGNEIVFVGESEARAWDDAGLSQLGGVVPLHGDITIIARCNSRYSLNGIGVYQTGLDTGPDFASYSTTDIHQIDEQTVKITIYDVDCDFYLFPSVTKKTIF